MKRLQEQFPEERAQKRRVETDAMASNYVQSLYALLPTLDLTNDRQRAIGQTILDLAKHVAMAQKDITGDVTAPLQGAAGASEPVTAMESEPELTDEQLAHLTELVTQHGIYAAKDQQSGLIYIEHPALVDGNITAKNQVEAYHIALDIDRQMTKEAENERKPYDR